MPELTPNVPEEEDERERTEAERKEQLKKEAEAIEIGIALKKAAFREHMEDRRMMREIAAAERRWDHIMKKYERSLQEVRRLQEEKTKDGSTPEQKKRLSDIDKEIAEANEKYRSFLQPDEKDKDTPEKEQDDPEKEKDAPEKEQDDSEREKDALEKEREKPEKEKEKSEKDKETPEKEKGKPEKEKDAPEKEQDAPEKERKAGSPALLEPEQERIRKILRKDKPEDKEGFENMRNELKEAMADLIAKRAAFIDPNNPRETFIRGDKKNEEHYQEAYDKLMAGENKAFNRTIAEMGSYEQMRKIGASALTNNAGGLMLFMGDQMKKEDIRQEAKTDKVKEKILNTDKELVLKPQEPMMRR